MSWQATAWVLNDGPRPDDLDRTGKRYGTKARGMRLVLLVIADAANKDGQHAHPGNAAIEEGSLYGRSQALAIVADLIAEGWLVVEEQGKGRGHATVYGVALDRRETVRPSDPSEEANRPATEREPSDLDAGTVRSGAGAPISPTALNEPTSAEAPPPRATDDPVKARAHALATLAFEQEPKPVTRGGFLAVMARLEVALRAGYVVQDLERAILAAPITWTADGLTTAIAKANPRRRLVGGLNDSQHALADYMGDRTERNAG